VEVGIRHWEQRDLPLLEKLLVDPAMTEHLGGPESPEKLADRHDRYCRSSAAGKDNAPSNAICREVGFELLGELDFEYPPGHSMRCNDWCLDLRVGMSTDRT
jgi:hypothetical protein